MGEIRSVKTRRDEVETPISPVTAKVPSDEVSRLRRDALE